jgi:hypothetical protein
MTVRKTPEGNIELSGHCGVEDAEPLLRELLASGVSPVQWHACEHLHSAVLRVLLVANAPMQGVPPSWFLRTHVAPLLSRRMEQRTRPQRVQRTRHQEGDKEQ